MGLNDEELAPDSSSTTLTASSPTNQITHNNVVSSHEEVGSSNNVSISNYSSSNASSSNSSKMSSPTQDMPEGGSIACGTEDESSGSSSRLFTLNSNSQEEEKKKDNNMEEEREIKIVTFSRSPSPGKEIYNNYSSCEGNEVVSPALSLSIRPAGDDETVNKIKSQGDDSSSARGNCTIGSVQDDNQVPPRGRDTRKKSFVFGLSKLNLRVFSRSSRSTERLEEPIMNNQLQNPPVGPSVSSVSKSSSESNIPMCHNSLDNLTDDLPSSRSTDSSCLLPCTSSSCNMNNNFPQNEDIRTNDVIITLRESETSSSSSDNQNDANTRDTTNDETNEIGGASECVASSSGNVTSTSSSGGGESSTSCMNSFGQKFKLVTEGDVQVCKVKHGNNLMDKFIGSKLLRRWETHHIYLNDSCISSKTAIGSLASPVSYWQMQEVYVCVRLDSKSRYVIRIVLPDGSLLLQGSNAYVRDQWYYSILWKKNIFKYQNLMRSSRRPEVILKELKSLVDFATTTPLQDDCISHVPIEIVSNLLDSAGDLLGKNQAEEVLVALSPLLERSHPPPSLCRFFSRQCRTRPRCPLVGQLFTPVVRRALKHNDFGKYPYMRRFIQDFIQALNCHNDGVNVVRNFVKSIHGPASSCPHPRVLSNLVSVCLAAMFQIFEKNINKPNNITLSTDSMKDIPYDEQLLCYLAVLDTISEFEDWRPSLAQLLQPIPFPDEALSNPLFTRSLSSVIRRIGTDNRCDVHQMVLGIRDGKEGWFHLFSPSFSGCSDDGELWGLMLERLLSCCSRRKRFLSQLGGKLLGSCLLLALREHEAAQEALSLLLEWQIVMSDDQRVQIATTLQSTPTGRASYLALCGRQLHLKELQQKGGPRKLTLPSRSTDKDLAKLLSCGSFGNLECLSLAFTGVTSACAEQLIKLPSLRYLNLWSTQFGDPGLVLISEHLPNLQVLNLCETPVTDKGLLSLTCMTSLRKLNLNSTHLSAQTFESLKKKLPALKEIDVRYTDAW